MMLCLSVSPPVTLFNISANSLGHSIDALKAALPIAMNLHRAILRTGTALIEKRQVLLLRAFRFAVVKEGPDLAIFTHPNALSKLALWLSGAILEKELSKRKQLPLVIASLNERRGIYVVVGTAQGSQVTNTIKIQKKKDREARKTVREEKRRQREEEGLDEEEEEDEESDDEDDDDDDDDDDGNGKKGGRNTFGIAFQEVANSTQARIRIDSFEATVVEVKKDDLAGFLESLSMKSVMG
jgi:cell division control protein 45